MDTQAVRERPESESGENVMVMKWKMHWRAGMPTLRATLRHGQGCPRSGGRRGAILVLVLWLLVIVSLIGLSYSSTVRTGLRITANRTDKIKARYYAKAGIERTIAELLERQEPAYGELSGFFADEAHFAMQPIGEGYFTLLTNQRGEDGLLVFGITDEASRVNLNTITEDALLSFPEITQEMAASLIDWRDDDWEMGLDGAEDEYYSALPDPYYCKNAELQTVAELMLVRGWTQVELYGEDANENGRLDPNEDDGEESAPLDDGDGELDMGLAPFFTIYATDAELDPNGEERLALGSASQEDLMRIEGMTEQQARSIVAWRNGNSFESLAALFDVTVAQENQNNQGGGNRSNQSNRQDSRTMSDRRGSGRASTIRGRTVETQISRSRPGGQSNRQTNQNQPSGQRAFTFEQIESIIDYVCVDTEPKRNRININTAPYEVLMTLPGMTDDLAWQILTHRESLGPFASRGGLREVSGMTEEILREMIDYVTVQSYQFRMIVEGRHGDAKAVIEVVVDLTEAEPRILYWHES